ncbi:MAG TPA: biotin/lipoyl-containing protein [Pseudonocardiaceae bacterium]|jgi:pyruvate dehydrogenase E2 component (dihydrolipoamide acetyltransferase)
MDRLTECVFRLPDLGEGLVSGEIIEWLVKVGEQVEVDQLVVVVETEKTTVELPIPFGGTVVRLHGEPADRLPVGAPLVTIEAAEVPDRPASAITHLVGQGPNLAAADADDRLAGIRRLPQKTQRERVAASPAVRRLARELDVDLSGVVGTGMGGAITKDDVSAASRNAES